MKTAKTFILLALAFSMAVPAMADWTENDPVKMHFPQLPDPTGYDIDMTNYTLADDWKCSESGNVSDIHFWYSIQGDDGQYPLPHITAVNVSIHTDVPVGPSNFSTPGDLKWSRSFDESQFQIAGPFTGVQGWDDPNPDSDCLQDDHNLYWQLNITGIQDPFYQEVGNIYWLDLNVKTADPAGANPLRVGWKTSRDHFNDFAVFSNAAGEWNLIAVCTDNALTDLAFVITPEPATVTLLSLGCVLVLRRRRRI